MYRGSCLCGKVSFELLEEPKATSHCHCTMCQKQHGAAFATYTSVRRSKFKYLSGQDLLTSYKSSDNIIRKFCSFCGSNIEWAGHPNYPNWVSVPVAILDTLFTPESIEQLHTESRACWLSDS